MTAHLYGGFVGILLGSGAYTAYSANGLSYLSDDPRACVNCHIVRKYYDGWQKAGHHAVATRNDRHVLHSLIPRHLAEAIDMASRGQIALPRPEKAADTTGQSTDGAVE